MKRKYAFSQLGTGDIISYKIKNIKYLGDKSFKCLITDVNKCVIIEGLGRGLEIVVGDNEIVTLIESLDKHLK